MLDGFYNSWIMPIANISVDINFWKANKRERSSLINHQYKICYRLSKITPFCGTCGTMFHNFSDSFSLFQISYRSNTKA